MVPRVVVFISGRGSNLNSLIESAGDYQIVGIVSDRSDAPGLEFGTQHKIPTAAISRTECQSVAEQKKRLYQVATTFKPDLVALAGYLQIVAPEFVEEFRNRIVNIHPSLLPKYAGLHGLAPHESAITAQDRIHGCSVHLVDEGIDTGPVIAQAACRIEGNDSVETLAARVLALEHRLYPWVISQIARGEINLTTRPLTFSPGSHTSAGRMGFNLYEEVLL